MKEWWLCTNFKLLHAKKAKTDKISKYKGQFKDIPNKELICYYLKKKKKTTLRSTHKWARGQNRQFTREEI